MRQLNRIEEPYLIKVAQKRFEILTSKMQGRTFDSAKGIPPINL